MKDFDYEVSGYDIDGDNLVDMDGVLNQIVAHSRSMSEILVVSTYVLIRFCEKDPFLLSPHM